MTTSKEGLRPLTYTAKQQAVRSSKYYSLWDGYKWEGLFAFKDDDLNHNYVVA
jgi:hypothetical protein